MPALEWRHLHRQPFAPQTNAYGSLFFVLSWLLCFTVVIALGANVSAQFRVWQEG